MNNRKVKELKRNLKEVLFGKFVELTSEELQVFKKKFRRFKKDYQNFFRTNEQ